MKKRIVQTLQFLLVLLAGQGCSLFGDQTTTIGIVNSIGSAEPAVEGFIAGMADYGYVDGENVIYQYAGVPEDAADVVAQVEALVAADVDLIFSVTTAASQAAKEASADIDIPVVFAAVRDPIGEGLVENLRQPGGNLTGVLASGDPQETTNRRLGWFVSIAPNIQKIWVPYQASEGLDAVIAGLIETADGLGLELVVSDSQTPEDVNALLENIPADIDSIFYIGGRAFVGLTDLFISVAIENNLPMSVNYCSGVAAGALMAYCSDFNSSGEQAARLANLILTGTPPRDIPVEQPELLLMINLKTANTIGVVTSDDILDQADEIVR